CVLRSLPRSLCPPLFPYTTLFRSSGTCADILLPPIALIYNRLSWLERTTHPYSAHETTSVAKALKQMQTPAQRQIDPVQCCDTEDRKSTRLNSSHVSISYAVFCLK